MFTYSHNTGTWGCVEHGDVRPGLFEVKSIPQTTLLVIAPFLFSSLLSLFWPPSYLLFLLFPFSFSQIKDVEDTDGGLLMRLCGSLRVFWLETNNRRRSQIYTMFLKVHRVFFVNLLERFFAIKEVVYVQVLILFIYCPHSLSLFFSFLYNSLLNYHKPRGQMDHKCSC